MAGKVLDDVGLAELWSLIKAEDAKGAKIAKTSYVGTGTYGSAAPNTLTFDFEPFCVVVTPDTYRPGAYYNTDNVSYVGRYGDAKLELVKGSQPIVTIEKPNNVMASATMTVSFNGNTVQWYMDSGSGVQESKGPTAQCNVSGTTYNVIAIGK